MLMEPSKGLCGPGASEVGEEKNEEEKPWSGEVVPPSSDVLRVPSRDDLELGVARAAIPEAPTPAPTAPDDEPRVPTPASSDFGGEDCTSLALRLADGEYGRWLRILLRYPGKYVCCVGGCCDGCCC